MEPLEGIKVISAAEMVRVEKASIAAGASAKEYMQRAGEGIATRVEAYVRENGLEKVVTLLVGKGNNGGDARVAGKILLKRGFKVAEGEDFEGVILDGLLGTGFRGEVEGEMAQLIERANSSKLPILSIDTPSGGKIEPRETLYLGLPKIGGIAGKLHRIDFGMEERYLEGAKASAYLLNRKGVAELLPPLKPNRHKYEAGYVIALAGSPGMPGAAILSSLAALRTGAGIVRLFHPEGMEEELAPSPYELIRTPYSWDDPSEIFEEAKRAGALLIGPGLGKGEEMGTFIREVTSKLTPPCVIDADALLHLKTFPKGAVLTPHSGEMKQLLGGETPTQKGCQAFTDQHGVTLVLKGAPTWIYHPKTLPLIANGGDPGMATAGTGDVLTGMIAALLAQKLEGREAAALGVTLHNLAGERAAEEKTSYDMIASDLIDSLPSAFKGLSKE